MPRPRILSSERQQQLREYRIANPDRSWASLGARFGVSADVAHMTVDANYRRKNSGLQQGGRACSRSAPASVHVVFREPAHKRDAAERMRERDERARAREERDNTGLLLGDPPAWRSALAKG